MKRIATFTPLNQLEVALFRVVYEYEGQELMTGSMPLNRARMLVDKGHGKAVITADSLPIQVYPATTQGERHASTR